MTYSDHITAMNELSSSEGVFTTAQAQRLGIPRDALAHACAAGRAERICRGAYRLAGTQSRETDALAAIWKVIHTCATVGNKQQARSAGQDIDSFSATILSKTSLPTWHRLQPLCVSSS